MASCQLSVALISRRSTLAFSAVSLDLPAATAADSLSAVASGSSETGTSRGAVRDGGAHQGRFASPGGEGTAATLAVAAIVLGRWIFAGRRVGGDGKVVAMGTGIRKEKRDRLKDGEGVWSVLRSKSCREKKVSNRVVDDYGRRSLNLSNESHGHPWRIYRLRELIHATENFREGNKLGEGGFGAVYWGRTSKGVEIAVKRLKAMTAKAEMEFAIEVEILARVRHKNLLSLRGFSAGKKERLIVYDYMPNNSLHSHLHGRRSAELLLDWRTRTRIAIGAAEGLAYLHHEASPHIIHRDIKAGNVLLDADFCAKVADFGFGKLIPEGVSHMTTRVKGTLGYLAPEYAMFGKVSESCDVYSFGILLLEIVSARKPIEKLPGGDMRDIVQWASLLAAKGAWGRIADPRLGGNFKQDELQDAVVIAFRCTDLNPENRPTMKEVVALLKGR
ncbi:hypothetical protein B296_00006284 [Ensete ventricosum]|uniref:Protein kinase domain-containing protein n=1 Tax=Ensete ventricosum TaxID=4639 RepID=A0A427AAR9_ENSVE|nr:hypothetical protein B296_00006284 [Ensete ventricosum]